MVAWKNKRNSSSNSGKKMDATIYGDALEKDSTPHLKYPIEEKTRLKQNSIPKMGLLIRFFMFYRPMTRKSTLLEAAAERTKEQVSQIGVIVVQI